MKKISAWPCLLMLIVFALPVLISCLSLENGTIVTRGPYVQRTAPDQATIHWRTDRPSESILLFGLTPENFHRAVTLGGKRREHVIRIDGLVPDTKYYYKVLPDTGVLSGADYYFHTSPRLGSHRPVRIWVLGDSGYAGRTPEQVRDAYKRYEAGKRTDIWLMLGDNAYDDGKDPEYQTAIFDMHTRRLANTALWPAFGNHDAHSADAVSGAGPYFEIFDLPKEGEAGGFASGSEAYYSFDYANIHFLCLDSFGNSRETDGRMFQWLENDLHQNRQRWIVAYWHHAPYSKGSHDSDTSKRMLEMRETFLPLLEQYGVDLVLAGHSHSYERSYLIDGHYGMSGTFDPAIHVVDYGKPGAQGETVFHKTSAGHGGTVYVVAGSSAKAREMKSRHPVMAVSRGKTGSLVLDVDGDRLDARFITAQGKILDHFALTKQ